MAMCHNLLYPLLEALPSVVNNRLPRLSLALQITTAAMGLAKTPLVLPTLILIINPSQMKSIKMKLNNLYFLPSIILPLLLSPYTKRPQLESDSHHNAAFRL